MKTIILATILGVATLLCGQSSTEQTEHPKESQKISPCQDAPREAVEKLWRMAALGELLTSKGWADASSLFTKPGPPSGTKAVRIVSDYYAVNSSSANGTDATVDVGFLEAGQIDASLRYSAPSPMPPMVLHASLTYHLKSEPASVMMYGTDGKTLVGRKEIPGATVWRIEGPQPPPWVAVNAGIRYVVEMRQKTTDPVTKKNAEETLAKLMKLH